MPSTAPDWTRIRAGVPRYPGTRPFADNEFDRALFRGRNRELNELFHLVLAERLTVLFARSGMGKTSLINAGLLERLRRREYWPVVTRVNDTEAGPLATLYQGLEAAAQREGLEFQPGAKASLWHFFKTAEVWRGDTLLMPVLIVDQFEELFTLHRREARRRFVDQLADLARGTRPAATPPADDQTLGLLTDKPPNVKIVLSLREDFLANLEELAGRIPGILNNRFRLGPLRRESAREAIAEPARQQDEAFAVAPFEWSEAAVDRLLDFLGRPKAADHDRAGDEVEAFQLQLICQQMEAWVGDRQDQGAGRVVVRADDVGDVERLGLILSGFYEECVKVTARRVDGARAERRLQHLCEYGLITDRGRRLSLGVDDIERRFRVPPEALDELVRRRLLRVEPRIGQRYYELTHDTLIDPILASRKRRDRHRRRRWAALAAIGFLVPVIVLLALLARQQGQLINVSTKLGEATQQTAKLTTALQARELADALAAEVPRARLRGTEIWYFTKPGEVVDLVGVLSGYGFRVERKQPKNRLATNSLFVGREVSLEEAKLIAYTMIAAGLEIRRVRRFNDARYRRPYRLVQIGSEGEVLFWPPLELSEIESAGELPWTARASAR